MAKEFPVASTSTCPANVDASVRHTRPARNSNPDGPAAKAGIKKGDVIKAINGKVIKDIYEYMDRLGKLEKGMTVPVLVDRDGAEINFNLSF